MVALSIKLVQVRKYIYLIEKIKCIIGFIKIYTKRTRYFYKEQDYIIKRKNNLQSCFDIKYNDRIFFCVININLDILSRNWWFYSLFIFTSINKIASAVHQLFHIKKNYS